MRDKCLVCERIERILNNANPYFVAELETGYVVLGDFQYFKGYALLLCKKHKTELHHLDSGFRMNFLREMSELAEAVNIAFKPSKINYELLGNSNSHMHWHIFPRFEDDPKPDSPIWCIDKAIRCSENTKPDLKELERIKSVLLAALRKTAMNIKSC
ncbi:MAG: HIT family protein [Patescibacteria group bacterium]